MPIITGHVLGFWHEQSRGDRDAHVRVESNNIIDGALGHFHKRSEAHTDVMNMPYDFGSIMHYQPMVTFSLVFV